MMYLLSVQLTVCMFYCHTGTDVCTHTFKLQNTDITQSISDSIVFPFLWHIQHMIQLTVSSAVQDLSYRSIGSASHTRGKKDELSCRVLLSLLQKVLKWVVESWQSPADQKAADLMVTSFVTVLCFVCSTSFMENVYFNDEEFVCSAWHQLFECVTWSCLDTPEGLIIASDVECMVQSLASFQCKCLSCKKVLSKKYIFWPFGLKRKSTRQSRLNPA